MFSNLQMVYKKITLNQQRIVLGCILRLPDEIKDKTPQSIIKNCTGDLLLSFNTVPKIGELFPYGFQIWKVTHEPIQRPTRYKSHQAKSPALIFPEWVCSYETEDEALIIILGNSHIKPVK